MQTMTNAQIEKHLTPRMGVYNGTRKGGENCVGYVRSSESAESARQAAKALGAHFVTWQPDSPQSADSDDWRAPADESVRRNAKGRLAPRS